MNTYESEMLLTVTNVKNHSRLHYTCGNSFILFTAIILELSSIFSGLPIYCGQDYYIESYLRYPGLWLQLLTTKEPYNEQIEVAIRPFEEMKQREEKIQLGVAHTKIG